MVLSEFSKDEAQIWQTYGDIPNWLDACVFKVRIPLVWRQFQLKVDQAQFFHILIVLTCTILTESLKDLVRFLRRDDTTCEIRRQLGYSEVLQNVCLTVAC